MPLQDAARQSWRQMLANDRQQHGAYDPVRLAKLLPPKLRLQKRSFRSSLTVQAHRTLAKRDGGGGSDPPSNSGSSSAVLPPAPANPGGPPPPSSPDDQAETVPANIPQINYGSAAPNNDVPTTNDTATHNDTAPAAPPSSDQSYTLTPSDLSSGSDDDAAANDEDGSPHRMIGMVCGLVLMLLVLIVLGYLFKRYRQKLLARYRGRRSGSAWKRSQRLGSIDLRSRSGAQKVKREDKVGSSDFLVQSAVSGGPFDRAISTMFTTPPQTKNGGGRTKGTAKDERGTTDYLGVVVPKGGLSPQRSLDSIAEVQEPPSVTSANFRLTDHRRSLLPREQLPSSTPKRPANVDRPKTSPGRTSSILTASPSASTLLGSPPEGKPGKWSPGRPQSAKGGDIEMTRRGSTLVIRDRASIASLRRPLSSAGNPFKSALRKTRGEDDGAICIETDDLISRAGESDLLHPPRSPVTGKREKVEGDDGVVELSTPVKGGLQSHFSSSTLCTPRGSCATSVSPSGSFSFEIRDAVRRCAPVTLSENVDRPKLTARTGGTAEKEKRSTVLSVESFVKDLDWNVSDCSLVDEAYSPPHKHKAEAGA